MYLPSRCNCRGLQTNQRQTKWTGHEATLPTLNWDYSAGQGQPPTWAAEGSAEPVDLSGSKQLSVHLFCCAVTIKPYLLSTALLLHSCWP